MHAARVRGEQANLDQVLKTDSNVDGVHTGFGRTNRAHAAPVKCMRSPKKTLAASDGVAHRITDGGADYESGSSHCEG